MKQKQTETKKFRHGSLFSGIGGFDLAAEWMGWENVFHCEWNEFGQKVLNYYWPKAESFGDITKTDFTKFYGTVDIISGGFPCQDASNANQSDSRNSGSRGTRTGLVFEMLRTIREIRPKYVVAENVANILKINGGKDFGSILTELASMGYNAEWRVCYASEQGASHKRSRCYMVIYPDSIRLQKGETFIPHVQKKIDPYSWNFAGVTVPIFRGGSWKTEPPVLLVDDGVSSKLYRESIKALGNAVVPQIPYEIFKAIEHYEKGDRKEI
jgi:DNA (cytosine-5)-methyltransferase 1